MPPLPKSKSGSAKGARSGPTSARERGSAKESSSAPPVSGSRSRNTKLDTLQSQLVRMYATIGIMVKPFGSFYPVLDPIGNNLVSMSDAAAEAWIDLAAKDKRVLEILESITGASTWGNLIGIHLAIFASALPGAGYISQVTEPQEDELTRQGKAMGMTDEEIELARATMMAGAAPARDTSTGGPGDTVATPPPPEYSGEPVTSSAAPPVGQSRSAIVTPQELGVTQVGPDNPFPNDASPPNGAA